MEFATSTKVASESELDEGCKKFAIKLSAMIKDETVQEEIKKKVNEKPEQEKKYTYPLRTVSYISGSIGLISLGIGIYYDTQVKKNNDAAQNLYNEYSVATANFNTEWNAFQDKKI